MLMTLCVERKCQCHYRSIYLISIRTSQRKKTGGNVSAHAQQISA